MTIPKESNREQIEAEVIAGCVDHWFLQGGKAQFGPLDRTPFNPDELIAQILHRVRMLCPTIAAPPDIERLLGQVSEKLREAGIEVMFGLTTEGDVKVYRDKPRPAAEVEKLFTGLLDRLERRMRNVTELIGIIQRGTVIMTTQDFVLALQEEQTYLGDCRDALARVSQPQPDPPWQPSELALIASVFADAAHEAGESDEEDVRLEAPMLSALSRKAALAVPRDYNPLPPAPPQAKEHSE